MIYSLKVNNEKAVEVAFALDMPYQDLTEFLLTSDCVLYTGLCLTEAR